MDFLRRAAKTWVAKLLLILLVASFGVWGISGSILQNNSTTVVSVGDEKVGPEEFYLAYRQQVGAISQQFGRNLTTEEARAFGIEDQVFGSLATNAALDQQASELNLGVSEKRQGVILSQQPIFQDSLTGQFDQGTFRRVLQNIGMSESQYLTISAKEATRSQVTEAVSDGFKIPQTLLKALAEYRTEKRDIDYLVLTPAILDEMAAATDEQLKTYFDANIARYAAPEYRKISYLKLTSEDIIDLDGVSEEAIVQEYEARQSSYSTEESRAIDQLTFKDDVAADAALAKLNSGTSFDDLLVEEGKTASDVSIGTFTKNRMPDQSLADAAFSVPAEGGNTDVLKGTFGPVILRVSKIEPAVTRTLDDVKEDIRRQLALIAAADTLLDVHDAYEDDRASGLTLIEAADKQNLKVVTIDMIDRTGADDKGVAVEGIPQSREVITQAFESDINLETPPINIGSEGFVWFEVLDIIAARDRTLDEVKDRVSADWLAAETEAALVAKADELKKQLDDGKTLAAIADEHTINLEKKIDITRGAPDAVFNLATIEAAFAGPIGLTTVAPDASGANQVLMKVVAVNVPEDALSDQAITQNLENFNAVAGNEVVGQFVSRLQSEYGVTVNRELASHILAQ
jgi:peptidyl-prolyl cis-trans isomerase D